MLLAPPSVDLAVCQLLQAIAHESRTESLAQSHQLAVCVC